MSKKISSIVTSIAGVMVAIPTTSHANIATTGYVNKIVNQTHAVGSALQFGLLSDNATPLFMLGATNQPTTGADGGSLVGSYGAISLERLGKHLAGFESGNGSFVLVGDGTTTGTAGWMGIPELALNIPGSYIAGYGSFYIDKTDDSASAKLILGQSTDNTEQLENQSAEWFRVDKLGKHLAGFDVRGDQALTGITHMLAGNGTTSGTAQWIKIDKLAPYMPGSQITGYGTGHGNFLLIGDGTENASAGWGKIQDVLAGLRATGIDEQTTGAPSILVRDNNFSNEAHWAGPNWLAEQLHGSMITNYSGGQEENTNGSLYLLGGDGTTSGTARWVGMNDFAYSIPGDYLAGFYTGFVNGTDDYQQPMYIMGQGSVDPTQLSMQSPAWYSVSQLARTLSGFATGSGSFVLVGDGTTSGTAGWSSVQDMLKNGLYGGSAPTDTFAVPMYSPGKDIVQWAPPLHFTANMVSGSGIMGYTAGSGLYPYVLAGEGGINSTAKWASLSSLISFPVANGFNIGQRSIPANQTDIWIPASISTLGTQPTANNQISGYVSLSEAGRYVGGYHVVSGSALLANTGSAILSYIQSTAQPNGEAGKIYQTFMQNERIYGVEGGGSLISGFGTGSGSYVLVGDGTTTGTAAWSTIPDMFIQNPSYTGTGQFNFMGFDDKNKTLVSMTSGDFISFASNNIIGSVVASKIPGSLISGYNVLSSFKPTQTMVSANDVDIHILSNMAALGSVPDASFKSAWAAASMLGRYIGGFDVVSASELQQNTGSTILSSERTNTSGTGTPGVIYPTFVQNSRIYAVSDGAGQMISGYGTGTGSYVLVGNSTTGAAHFTGASNLSKYMRGSLISGYSTGSGAPTYILGTNTTGTVTGATMKLHAISGLGSEIKFTETKTAAEISASTGTVYFPVIQNGQIYGVTLNDFYILMNAKF